MRIALAALLSSHGAIHLMGFLRSWKLSEIPQLTGPTLFPLPEALSRAVGLGWLFSCLVFVGAASMLLFRYGPWWLVACIGIVISQLLVIHAWPDAKAGTLVNILFVIPVIIAWADARFQNDTDEQARALFARASSGEVRVVTADMLAPLPQPVRRWVEKAGVVGKRIPRTVRLKQRGLMRISPDKDEVPATAQQYFRLDEPEFIWRVRVRMMRFLPVAGRDTYADGRGRMLIKVASLIPVVDATGEKMDQGTLLRYLAESVWFPAAVLSPYIRWAPIDETSARATMTHGGMSGTAVFSFDDKGRFAGLTADRYFGGGPDAKLERWEVEATDWDVMDGCLVPVRGQIRWKLEEGDFTFYRWEVSHVEYDPPGLFATEEP